MLLLRVGFVAALVAQVVALYFQVPTPDEADGIPQLDKVVHAAIFAAPAFLGVLAGLRPWLVGLVLAIHAPVSEVIQHLFLPGRAGDPWDMVADWVGVAIGIAAGVWVLRRAVVGRVVRRSGRVASRVSDPVD